MHFRYWTEGLIFIFIFLFIVGVPCFLIAVIGSRLTNSLGLFPTRSAKLQLAVVWQLLLVEIVSFIMLALFFRIFSD